LDPDSNPDPKLDPKIFYKKVHYFQVGISWFYMIIHISHLQVVASSNNRQVVVRSVADPCLLLMDPNQKLTSGRIRIRDRIRNFCFGSATLARINNTEKQCYGSGMFIPDPDFYPPMIRDPEKNFLDPDPQVC